MKKTGSTPSLKSGTNNTKPEIKKLFISSTEVCHILSECQKAGVSSLNFDSQGLKVEFAQAGPQVKEDLSAELPDHDEINQKTLAVEEQRTRDEQLALLQIEDPQEFERQLAAEEMSDEKSFEYEES